MPLTIRTRGRKRLLALPFALAAIAGSTATAIAAPRAEPARILFTVSQSGIAQVDTSTPAGQDLLKISNVPGSNYSPAASPDGKKVVYTNEQNGVVELYTANLGDGSATTRITDPPALAVTASWSLDSKKIVYAGAASATSPYSIFSMNPDGSGKVALTPPSATSDFNPVFSPDGRTLFFVRMTGTASSIFSLPLAADGTPAPGATPKAISPGPFDGYPVPVDASTVLFSTRSEDGRNSWIQRIHLPQDSIERLTSQTAFASQPHLGPNGGITFTTIADSGLRLGSMPLAGGPITILPIGGGDVYDGSYYPLVAAPVSATPPPGSSSVSTAPTGTTGRSGVRLNPFEIALGVVVVAGVAGGITYWVKLWPNRKKDDCDPLRIALAAARAEFTAAAAAMNEAEAAHNQATATTHEAEGRLAGYLDHGRGTGAQLETAHAEVATDKAAQEVAYKALTQAGLRQGTARLNVEVAEKRLAECEHAAAAATPPPAPAPSTPAPPGRDHWGTGPESHPPIEEDEDREPSIHMHIDTDPGFQPVPPSPPPPAAPAPEREGEVG